jgi:CubicO group peptidase (beta-lactamase class C family)
MGLEMIVAGSVAPGYEGVREAFEQGHAGVPGGAQLCVYREGVPVVDLWGGADARGVAVEADSLIGLASTTKGVLALLAATLIEDGTLDPRRPVADYWPEYGANGKEDVLLEHVLTHTTGTPTFFSDSGIECVELADWERCIRALERAEPLWAPGTRWSYHAVTVGFLLGEVIRRATGRTAGDLIRDRIGDPLRADVWVGLPPEMDERALIRTPWAPPGVEVVAVSEELPAPTGDRAVDEVASGTHALRDVIAYLNTPEARRAEIGGGGGLASARAIARIYAAAIGDVDGIRLFSAETLEHVTRDRTSGLPAMWPADLAAWESPLSYGLGFTVDGSALGPRWAGIRFGHGGAGGIQGFAHPSTELAAGYTCTDVNTGALDPRATWVDALADIATV